MSFLNQEGVTVAIGIIKSGKYSLDQSASYHGVPPGSYKVTVMSWIVRPGAQLPNGSMSHEGVSRIPRTYTDPATSGLTAEVGKSGGKIDFAVQGDGEKLP